MDMFGLLAIGASPRLCGPLLFLFRTRWRCPIQRGACDVMNTCQRHALPNLAQDYLFIFLGGGYGALGPDPPLETCTGA